MPDQLPSERLRALKTKVSDIAKGSKDSDELLHELDEIARRVECRDSPVRLEQYKTLEARIDRLGTTQFGLWPVGVGAFLGITALSAQRVEVPPLAWAICLVASILTIIGWQCSISANTIGRRLLEFHTGCERALTVIAERNDFLTTLGELGEFVAWPFVLFVGMAASLLLGQEKGLFKSLGVLLGGTGLAFLMLVWRCGLRRVVS